MKSGETWEERGGEREGDLEKKREEDELWLTSL